MNNFAQRWVFSTNHKNISILYCIFNAIAKIMDTCFSVLICMELTQLSNQIHDGNHQLYNVLILARIFLLIFFYGYVYHDRWMDNWFVSISHFYN
jgi:cytochrome c oxidase subunit 1